MMNLPNGPACVPAELHIATDAAMRDLGRELAARLHAGDLVILTGPLGAGKTTLVQGIGEGLGVRGPVTSPTFVIARVHPARAGSGPSLVHADAYRLGSITEVDDLDLDADVASAVTVVEWGEGLAEGLAEDRLEISIQPEPGRRGPDRPAPRSRGSLAPAVIRKTAGEQRGSFIVPLYSAGSGGDDPPIPRGSASIPGPSLAPLRSVSLFRRRACQSRNSCLIGPTGSVVLAPASRPVTRTRTRRRGSACPRSARRAPPPATRRGPGRTRSPRTSRPAIRRARPAGGPCGRPRADGGAGWS